MTINIEAYDKTRVKLSEIEEVCNFLPDVTTKDGYDKSKRVAIDVGKVITTLEKTRVSQKKYWIDGGKQVDLQAKELAGKLKKFQLPHKEAYKNLDNEKKEREAARKSAIEERLENIKCMPDLMREMDSESIKSAMNDMNNEECLDFSEYTEQALRARNNTRNELSILYTKTLKSENEAVELERLRRESEERERLDREEAIRREASEKSEKAAQDAIDKSEREKQDAIHREEKLKRDFINAENARIEADKKAIADKQESDRLAEEVLEQAEIDKKAAVDQAIIDAENAHAEKERIEGEEKNKRLADVEHKKNINSEIFRSIKALNLNIDNLAIAELIMVISESRIEGLTINY